MKKYKKTQQFDFQLQDKKIFPKTNKVANKNNINITDEDDYFFDLDQNPYPYKRPEIKKYQPQISKRDSNNLITTNHKPSHQNDNFTDYNVIKTNTEQQTQQMKNLHESKLLSIKNQYYDDDFQDHYQSDFQNIQEYNQNIQQKNNKKDEVKQIQKQRQLSLKKQDKKNKNSMKSIKSSRSYKILQSVNENKYLKQILKEFPPDNNLNILSIQKISLLNEKLKERLKKWNNDIKQILLKNELELMGNNKKEQKLSQEDRLRILKEEYKNNDKIIQRQRIEIKKLRSRVKDLKQTEYQINLMKDIQISIQKKKQLQKLIQKIKYDLSNQQKKLNTPHQNKFIQYSQQQKSQYLYYKKQQQKYIQILNQLQPKILQAQTKNSSINTQYIQILNQAKQRGIQIQPQINLHSKYQQLILKQQNQRKNFMSLQSKLQNKVQHYTQQITLYQRKIANTQSQIKNMFSEIDYVIKQCYKIIDDIKEKPTVFKYIQGSLNIISKSLQNQPIQDYERLSYKSQKSDRIIHMNIKSYDTRSQASRQKKPILSLSKKNKQKNSQLKTQETKIIMKQVSIQKLEPETKETNVNKSEDDYKLNQSSEGKSEKISISNKMIENQQKIQQTKIQQINKDLSKPFFSFKKKVNIPDNKNLKSLIIQQKKQIILQPIQIKKQQNPYLQIYQPPKPETQQTNNLPRITRFRKNLPVQSNKVAQNIIQIQQNKQIAVKKQQQIANQKSNLVPVVLSRRLGLKRKLNQEKEEGYNPTFLKEEKMLQNENIKMNISPTQGTLGLGKQLRRNIGGTNSNNEFKIQRIRFSRNSNDKMQTIEQKTNNNTIISNTTNNTNIKVQNINKNMHQIKSRRQNNDVNRQRININRQIQEGGLLKQALFNEIKQEELDINKLLGIKPRNYDEQDLIYGQKKVIQKKIVKRQNDFFGFQI